MSQLRRMKLQDSEGNLITSANPLPIFIAATENEFMYQTYRTILQAGSASYLIKTGTADSVLSLNISTIDNNISVLVYESTVTTDDGTIVAQVAKDRDSIPTPTVSIYYGPATSTEGTLLLSKMLTPGVELDLKTLILNPSTNYLIIVTEQNVGAAIVNFDISHME